jgi:hypothetical protein
MKQSADNFIRKQYNTVDKALPYLMMEILHKTSGERHRWVGISVCLSLFLLLCTPIQVMAEGAISQGFQTTNPKVTPGTLLSFGSTQGVVELATTDNVADLVGVAGTSPLLELSGSGKNIQVVISGVTETLVSNVNGNISAGDKVTASPFAGIGMRATEPTEIVGVAQQSLSATRTLQQSVVDRSGKREKIEVGVIPINVNVAFYPAANDTTSLFLPPFLQTVANTLSGGSQVSPLRVLASTLILLLGFSTVSIMLYASIKSSIISIGRNPLANNALRKGLIDVLIMAAGVLLITLVTMYIVVTG